MCCIFSIFQSSPKHHPPPLSGRWWLLKGSVAWWASLRAPERVCAYGNCKTPVFWTWTGYLLHPQFCQAKQSIASIYQPPVIPPASPSQKICIANGAISTTSTSSSSKQHSNSCATSSATSRAAASAKPTAAKHSSKSSKSNSNTARRRTSTKWWR